jgi:hypothetical protein
VRPHARAAAPHAAFESATCYSEKGVRLPKICNLARAFAWGYSYKRLKLAQLTRYTWAPPNLCGRDRAGFD